MRKWLAVVLWWTSPALVAHELPVGVAAWQTWVQKQPAPCSDEVNSISVFQSNPTPKTALVLHGYASSPANMKEIIGVLAANGYNVIAPRLRGHYDADLKSLDRATVEEWIDDSEAAFKIARQFGPKVTLVGFSLGGLLASRLALKHGDEIDRMILFAPAWRVPPWLTVLSIIQGSLSPSDDLPLACDAKSTYVLAAGNKIVRLVRETEAEFDGSFPDLDRTVFSMRVRHLLFFSASDKSVVSDTLAKICWNNDYCRTARFDDVYHGDLITDMSRVIDFGRDNGKTIQQAITSYLSGTPKTK